MIINFLYRGLCEHRIDLLIQHRFHITSIDVEVAEALNNHPIVFVYVGDKVQVWILLYLSFCFSPRCITLL